MQEVIDIEALLVWAYRDQCIDRSTAAFSPRGPSASPSSGLAQVLALGTRVDSSPFATRALGMRVADDAMTVHDAVLSLGDMWLDWREGGDVVVWDAASMEAAGMAMRSEAGRHLIAPACETGVGDASHPVQQACTSVLLMRHGRAGTRPDCHDAWRAAAGRPAGDGAADRWGRKRKQRLDGTEADLSAIDVSFDRALYGVWRAGLVLLAAQLDGELEKYRVTGPVAHEAPWTLTARAILPDQTKPNKSNCRPSR